MCRVHLKQYPAASFFNAEPIRQEMIAVTMFSVWLVTTNGNANKFLTCRGLVLEDPFNPDPRTPTGRKGTIEY